MATFETAQQRLDQALRRLEVALGRRMVLPSDGDVERALVRLGAERDDLAQSVAQLRSECERLNAALTQAQRDNHALREVNDRVAARLDGPIEEIDRLLEG